MSHVPAQVFKSVNRSKRSRDGQDRNRWEESSIPGEDSSTHTRSSSETEAMVFPLSCGGASQRVSCCIFTTLDFLSRTRSRNQAMRQSQIKGLSGKKRKYKDLHCDEKLV
ncbi:hypothetical protein AVEN_175351-1 [Araneus ventricosus]|uniref:Uncharacterized protein n=1 Tax=Araneus ventricosus TaxID=182803 RepID=A0A4Y2MY20_ARAVE|nr:hypothetical protein AVEN_264539-1 [Araneus ventricosus]GBN30722.1 hypothetical protein AVEN_24653-1 [Araneus ventricosus]GBN30737.1 hypothetical protein AVEN_155468-1 [Araneus ventricosus]GBN30745.1 hypothetical protein AVEN_175351-1 [Araneus ventricosus]